MADRTKCQLRSIGRTGERFAVEANENLANPLGWHWVGEAVADDLGVLRFNDPDRSQARRFYRFVRSTLSPTVDPLPASRFTPVSSLSPDVLAAAQQHLLNFGPAPGAPPGSDAGEWSNVQIAPTVALVFDPLYQNGGQPAYAELKVVAAGQPNGPAQGYMLVSLTDDDSPIVEFATRGDTKTERILRRVPSGTAG